jgi:hypothetical protein
MNGRLHPLTKNLALYCMLMQIETEACSRPITLCFNQSLYITERSALLITFNKLIAYIIQTFAWVL